jgi:hypothetical protein
MVFTRWNKIWVAITLFSGLGYNIYWLRGVTITFLGALSLQDILTIRFFSYTLPMWTGDLLHCLGFSIALLSVYSISGSNPKPFSDVKKYVAFALLFEGIFFLLLLPTNVLRIIDGMSPFVLYFSFVLQGLIVAPFLIVLCLKVWRYQETNEINVLKWASAAAVGYLTGIWIINVFKWLSMTMQAGMWFILSGITSLGFLNSVTILSLSLIFVVAGFYMWFKKGNRKLSIRLLALGLIMLGLHFVIFIFYTAFTDAWKQVLLTEIWPVASLGLGLSMLTEKN